MNYAIFVVAALMFCSLPGALGIICKSCIPDAVAFKVCDKPEQLNEVDCDNETPPVNLSQSFQGREYDVCYSSTLQVSTVLGTVKSYVMGCGVKVNSTNPSVVNCSATEQYVCSDARQRARQSGKYTISSCSSVCCDTKACNVLPTTAPPTAIANGNITSATATPSPSGTSGTSEVRPFCFGLLFIFLAVLMKSLV